MTRKSTTKIAVPPDGNALSLVGRRQRRLSRTRARLIQAARAGFAERGLDLTTIDSITERADVGKGTFYYHFPNKEKLVRELMREMMRQLAGAIREEVRGTASLGEALDGVIVAHMKFFSGRWEDYVLYFQGRADLTLEVGYEGMESPFVEYLECIEEVLAAVIKRRVSAAVLRRIACAVAGSVSGYYSFALTETDNQQIERTMRGALVAGLSKLVNEAVN